MAFSSDFELIDRILQGDNEAFGEIVLKYQGRVFNIAYRMLGSYEEAKDVAQEVFISVYKSLANFRKESSFYTYLYRIVLNLCKNKFKRLNQDARTVSLDDPIWTQEGEVRIEVPDSTYNPRQEFDKRDKEAKIQEAINSLEEDQKTVVVLRDIEMMSYEEISSALGINIGTIKSRLHRARQELKEKLKDVI